MYSTCLATRAALDSSSCSGRRRCCRCTARRHPDVRRRRTPVATRCERCWPDRAYGTLRYLDTLSTLGTRPTLSTGCTGSTLRSGGPGRSLRSLRPCRTCRPAVALVAFRSLGTGWSGRTGGARRPCVALLALRSSCAGIALVAFLTRLTAVALRTWVTLFALLTTGCEHVDLDRIANDVDDKIRYSERGQEKITQTLTSRCSLSG